MNSQFEIRSFEWRLSDWGKWKIRTSLEIRNSRFEIHYFPFLTHQRGAEHDGSLASDSSLRQAVIFSSLSRSESLCLRSEGANSCLGWEPRRCRRLCFRGLEQPCRLPAKW